MKKFTKSLLSILVLAIFTFSIISLGFKHNIVKNDGPTKSQTFVAEGHVLDPPIQFSIAPRF